MQKAILQSLYSKKDTKILWIILITIEVVLTYTFFDPSQIHYHDIAIPLFMFVLFLFIGIIQVVHSLFKRYVNHLK
jgi:hypothetical protein